MMSRPTDATYYERARQWVSEAFETVTAADSFYSILRDTPSYVPRRIAREVWAEYGEQTAWSAMTSRRDPDKPLLRRFFHDVDSISDFAYNVKIKYTGVDKETGLPTEEYKMIGFDYMPNQTEIESLALSDLSYSTPDTDPATVQWESVFYYHRQDLEW